MALDTQVEFGNVWEMEFREMREGRSERSWRADPGWSQGMEETGRPECEPLNPP